MVKLPAEERINDLISAYRSGDFAGAERLARRATRKWPDFDLGWNILSAALHAQGRLDKAAAAYARAIALSPEYAELRDNFGALLVQQGRLEEAEAQFREGIRLDPGTARTYANLAQALIIKEEPREALAYALKSLEIDPDNASARNTLGNALQAVGRREEARAAYLEAIEASPYYAKAHSNLAALLLESGMPEEAEKHYRLAVRSNPEYARARCGLGNLLAMLGRMDEAMQAYRRALSIEPGLAEAHRYLAWIKTFHERDDDLRNIEALLADRSLPDGDRAQLHYAAGKAYQDLGDMPDRAFEHFEKGAALRRRALGYDVAGDEALFERIARAYEGREITLSGAPADGAPTPVFIVGMPRSGTTLVEQLIAAHTDVHAMGEGPWLGDVVTGLDAQLGVPYPGWIDALSQSVLSDIAASYSESMRDRGPNAAAFTDKTPENFRYLGVITAAIPGARVIHVRRSPMDTCLSCYTQYFSSHVPYSYDLAELARYYRAYHGLMACWRRVLPDGAMLEIDYENLTGDPENQARRIIDYCGLEWQDQCLAFQDTGRLVQTASVAQARRTVNRRSVGRWRRYEQHLKPLAEALGDLAH